MNDRQKAITFAAFKCLEKVAKKSDGECELPPGTSFDVSGETITITLPPETIISRQMGDNGDGTCQKKATQNLYGWSILYAFVYQAERYLKKFNLDKRYRRFLQSFITRIVKRALDTGNTSEAAFKEQYPKVAKGIEELKQNLKVPMRTEPIPRMCPRNLQGIIVFQEEQIRKAA